MATERRKVGLLVLNWNGMEVLPRCLESLERAAASSCHELRLLLVDNGSEDGSDTWAQQEHGDWEILRCGGNLRFAGGVNRGLAQLLAGEPDYVCILNNDIEAAADLIDPLVADLEEEARRGAASPRIHYYSRRERIWYGGGHVGRVTRVSRHLGIRRRAVGRWLRPADTGYLTGCCIMGRAEFWKLTGGFDEGFSFYAEDVDLSLRARALGWTLRYQPQALLYHRVGFSSGGGFSPDKLRAQRLAMLRLIGRHVRPAFQPLAYLGWGWHVLRSVLGALLRGECGVIASLLRSLRPGRPGGAAP